MVLPFKIETISALRLHANLSIRCARHWYGRVHTNYCAATHAAKYLNRKHYAKLHSNSLNYDD